MSDYNQGHQRLIGRQLSHTCTTSVIPADCRVSCHAATRWSGTRATADWRCGGEVDRVTPGERRVGGCIQGKQMCMQCTVNEHRWCVYWHLRCHSGRHSTAAQSKPAHYWDEGTHAFTLENQSQLGTERKTFHNNPISYLCYFVYCIFFFFTLSDILVVFFFIAGFCWSARPAQLHRASPNLTLNLIF